MSMHVKNGISKYIYKYGSKDGKLKIEEKENNNNTEKINKNKNI